MIPDKEAFLKEYEQLCVKYAMYIDADRDGTLGLSRMDEWFYDCLKQLNEAGDPQ